MAVFAGALALLGQTWAQAHLAPTRTAIIMSMEPVFAAFFAVLLGGEDARRCGWCCGGAMVLAAMLDRRARSPRRKVEARGPSTSRCDLVSDLPSAPVRRLRRHSPQQFARPSPGLRPT